MKSNCSGIRLQAEGEEPLCPAQHSDPGDGPFGLVGGPGATWEVGARLRDVSGVFAKGRGGDSEDRIQLGRARCAP
jgi:hypothetical protein